jgi:hypothetical protein
LQFAEMSCHSESAHCYENILATATVDFAEYGLLYNSFYYFLRIEFFTAISFTVAMDKMETSDHLIFDSFVFVSILIVHKSSRLYITVVFTVLPYSTPFRCSKKWDLGR